MISKSQEVAVQLECAAKSSKSNQLELGKVFGAHVSDDLPSPVATDQVVDIYKMVVMEAQDLSILSDELIDWSKLNCLQRTECKEYEYPL